jgi:F-type H+-transporting ATPase subunit gamma
MASLRDIRKRIRSVKNTQKITRAMKLVSAAKLRRAQQAIVAARPYAGALQQLIARIAQRSDGQEAKHPLLDQREQHHRVMIVVLTSDRGMCGAFNSSVIRRTSTFIAENQTRFDVVELGTIGRRGRDFFKKRPTPLRREYSNVFDNLSYATARQIANELTQEFLEKELDAVYFVYNEFKSAITQEVRVEQLLPIAADVSVHPDAVQPTVELDYVYEPDAKSVLEELLPQYLTTQVWRALLESQASEHGARMSAMENATKNASDMISALTLVYNRARQASITKELMEIISGAEAQKG